MYGKLTGKALKTVLEQNLSPHRNKFSCNIMKKVKKKKKETPTRKMTNSLTYNL